MAGVDQDLLPWLDQLLAHRYRSILSEIHDELEHSGDTSYHLAAGLMVELEDRSAADVLADLCAPSVVRHLPELRQLLHARRRIRQGTYGICDVCGAPMQASWLETHLTAQLCPECEARHHPRRS